MAGEASSGEGFGGADSAEAIELDKRMSQAFMAFNSDAHKHATTGTLIQAWRPRTDVSGAVYLETKGLPVSIYGMGDMLAQFRYLCCSRRFSPVVPDEMGVVGRVFSTGKPEFCGDVQTFKEPAYLRAQEAASCNLHSMCAVPVYRGCERGEAAAVVELLWHDKDVPFGTAITRLQSCFETVGLYTTDMDISAITMGLNMVSLDDGKPGS
ncbi:unnamed protein product [Ostreobium quekettii]|uniref:NLP1-9 GAF domain-containing protein n=1 Tax=Ostreobium quekettii TaxID=121088 RepID=A0A8S1IMN7_9CHLO|nr:unnamed protein product [Ostreobium quekettii]|eukprot:evm.model.scf_1371.1 EVM.evm.TU.scf_1371.1   scf_1371:2399-5485(-)